MKADFPKEWQSENRILISSTRFQKTIEKYLQSPERNELTIQNSILRYTITQRQIVQIIMEFTHGPLLKELSKDLILQE